MDSLKKKFGKFAVSSEKMAKVKGGSLRCFANGGDTMKGNLDANAAKKWCAKRPSCIGCF